MSKTHTKRSKTYTKRKSCKNGGTRSRSRARRISIRNNARISDERLTAKQITKLLKGVPRNDERKELKEFLKTLEYENGYRDCYRNEPMTLLEQAQSRVHCYFTEGGL